MAATTTRCPRRRAPYPSTCASSAGWRHARWRCTGRAARLARQGLAARTPLEQAQAQQVRRWAAQLHAQGWRRAASRCARLAGTAGSAATARSRQSVAGVAPWPPPLPKALSVDHWSRHAEHRARGGDPALRGARRLHRRAAYGSGLRIAELVGLDVRAGPAALGWIDLDAGEAPVLGKGSKRRSVPVGSAARAALEAWRAAAGRRRAGSGCACRRPQRPARTASQIRSRLKTRAVQAGIPDARAPAHAAPLVRLAPPAVQRRPARGAGAARAREHRDDAGLHEAGLSAPGQGVRRRAPRAKRR